MIVLVKCFVKIVKKYDENHGNMTKPFKPNDGSYAVMLKADANYLWCSCGLSCNQPFCDGSHKGTDFLPLKLSFDELSYNN